MKICTISARNFRALENFDIALQPGYCAISGKNNAGKSAIVHIVQLFFSGSEDDRYNPFAPGQISYSKDATQWSSDDELYVAVKVRLNRTEDAEVFFVVETYAQNVVGDDAEVTISQTFNKDGTSKTECDVEGRRVDGQKASEILKKFRSASNLVVHNSISPARHYFFSGESMMEMLDVHFHPEDRKKISEAQKTLETRVKKATKQHKEELDKLLGRLSDKYQVELSSIEGVRSARYPLQVRLTDRSVEVPLKDWGAGTQNRTRILLSVLEAVRTRSSNSAEDRSTPIFLVEEPESFLHPSAQAEFGQVLNALADETQLQIIATTHSPYMLNQNEPSANILLERRTYRGLPRETTIKDTSGEDWMLPFAENLGIVPSEFASWKSVFGTHATKVILVEGQIDQEYFEVLKTHYPTIWTLPDSIEVAPYGGKDALKNTSILKFMINKFGRVFVTFDRDAEGEVKPALERVGLTEQTDFCPIGGSDAGSECIEGLLPVAIKQKVYADKHELVTALGTQDVKARKSAKSQLKQALLAEFKKQLPDENELEGFKQLVSIFRKAF